DPSRPRCLGQRLRVVESSDAGAASADVGFHHYGEAQTLRRLGRERRVIDDPRLGVWKSQLVEDLELERFGCLHLIWSGPVDDGNTDALQVPQPAQGVKRYLCVAAQISGRTGPVED